VSRVDFYRLGGTPIERVLPRIAFRVLGEGGRLLVVADDEALATALDRALWVDDPASFLPHARAGASDDAAQPLLIARACEPVNGARNIALVDGRWREEALGFERAFHFFDEAGIAAAREAWRQVKAHEGIEPHYWSQESGRWQEVA
jgi:DNA polymerase-3 subunit chi